MKTLMKTAMKTIMKSSLCALAALFIAPPMLAETLDTALFTKKSVLTISGYNGSTTLQNFPVLVRLSAGSPSGFAYADAPAGTGMRFADSEGNVLAHEIDTWNTDGTSLVWVSVPSLSGSSTTINMYWGAGDHQLATLPPCAVWTNANYGQVLHFSKAANNDGLYESANSVALSAVSGISGTAIETDAPVGTMLDAYSSRNNTSANGIKAAYSDSWGWSEGDPVTVSMWVKGGESGRDPFYVNGGLLSIKNKGATMQSKVNSVTLEGDWTSSEFTYFTVSCTGSAMTFYINGEAVNADPVAATSPASGESLFYWGNGSSRYKGYYDECRLRKAAESADWVKASYETMTKSDFVTFSTTTETLTPSAPTASPKAPQGTQLDPSKFTSRIPFRIAGYSGTDILDDIPVLVRINAAQIDDFSYGDLSRTDGGNFRFADADGYSLPFEIDTWDESSGILVWVSVPRLAGGNTTIYLYYGATTAIPANDPTEVWSRGNFNYVLHYQSEKSPKGLFDSSANALTSENPSGDTSVISSDPVVGEVLNSKDAHGLKTASADSWNWPNGGPATFSTWAKGTATDARGLFGSAFYVYRAGTSVELYAAGAKVLTAASKSYNQWGYYTLVVDSGCFRLYEDGALLGTVAVPAVCVSDDWYWGRANGSRSKSYLDESRIHNAVESGDYIAANYAMMTDASFTVAGSVEPAVMSFTPEILELSGEDNTVAVHGRVSAFNDGASLVSLTLKYGLSADALTETADLGSISEPGVFNRIVRQLDFSTTYYAQIVATDNNSAVATSAIASFTTEEENRIDASSFQKKLDFTITGYNGREDLRHFPVLVRLSTDIAGFSYDDCGEGGAGIRFATANGNLLEHAIDTWNTSGESLVWVDLTHCRSGGMFTLYLAPDCDPSELQPVFATNVWANCGIPAVWHMNELCVDSSANAYSGTQIGTACLVSSGGAVGSRFDGTGGHGYSIAYDEGWGGYGAGGGVSISSWVSRNATDGNYRYILGTERIKLSASTSSSGYSWKLVDGATSLIAASTAANVVGEWTQVAVVAGNGTVKLYANGEFVAGANYSLPQETGPFFVGVQNANGDNRWKGYLDEVRIHRAEESSDYVRAAYETVASAHFLTPDEVVASSVAEELTVRDAGVTVSGGTTATPSLRVAKMGEGATKVSVTLYFGSSETVANNPSYELDEVSSVPEVVSRAMTGLTPAATYYYAFKAVNNAATPVTVWTDCTSFMVEDPTTLDAASLAVQAANAKLTFSGTINHVGTGTTVAKLLVGDSEGSLSPVATAPVENGVMQPFVHQFDSIGTKYYKIVLETTNGANVWTSETSVRSVVVSDSAAYSWAGGDGLWTDAAMWTSADEGAAGLPTGSSNVTFPKGRGGVVLVPTEDTTVMSITIDTREKTSWTFETSDGSARIVNPQPTVLGDGTGKLSVKNIAFGEAAKRQVGKYTFSGYPKKIAFDTWSGMQASDAGTAVDVVLMRNGQLSTYYNCAYGNLSAAGNVRVLANGNKTISFTGFKDIGLNPCVEVVDGSVSFANTDNIPMYGGTQTLADATDGGNNPVVASQIPLAPNFAKGKFTLKTQNAVNESNPYGACTIENGVVRHVPTSSMKQGFVGAGELDNVYIGEAATLESDVTVNAVIYGASINLNGHVLTIKSGILRPSAIASGHYITNGIVRTCAPMMLCDGLNNSTERLIFELETEGNNDPEKCMLSISDVGGSYPQHFSYTNFTGTVSHLGKSWTLKVQQETPGLFIEVSDRKIIGYDDWGGKARLRGFGGIFDWYSGSGSVPKGNDALLLGELPASLDKPTQFHLVVGNGGILAPGTRSDDGYRRGTLNLSMRSSNVYAFQAIDFFAGSTFKATVRSDGSSTLLDCSRPGFGNTCTPVQLGGNLVIDQVGRVSGNMSWPVLKTGVETTGYFENAGENGRGIDGYRVRYNVPQPDGSYAVTVEKKGTAGTLIIVR